METTPTSRLIAITSVFTLVLCVTFIAFSFSGMKLQHSPLLFKNYSEVAYEAEEAAPGSSRAFGGPRPEAPVDPQKKPQPEAWSRSRPVGVPETAAEEAYYAAIRKMDERTQRMTERLKPREQQREFMESSLGKEMTLISAIAKRGRMDEAYHRLRGVLPQLGEQEFEVQTAILKFAIRLFQVQEDKEGLKAAIQQYLDKWLERLETPEGEAEAGANKPEMVRELRRLLDQVKSA